MWILALLLWADSTRAMTIAVAPAESLRVAVTGAGEPVVLLPGLFGSGFAYRKVVPQLVAAHYRTIVVEPLGVGGSSRPPRADYSLTAQADRVGRVLDSLGIPGAVVVAHAVGASIAFRLAYRRPELVRGIVAVEGGPAESATTRGFRRAMQLAPWIKLFGGVRLVRKKLRSQLVRESGDSSWVSDGVIDGYTADAAADLDATLRAYLAMGAAREPEALGPNLPRVRCAVRLVLGAAPHEGGPGPAEVAVMRAGLVAFTLDLVAGAGHFIHEERPDRVLAAVVGLAPPVTVVPTGSAP